MNINYMQLSFDAGSVFTPGAPINEKSLFAGRLTQIGQIMSAISQKGYHGVLYGERGVGKTSLSNVLQDFLSDAVGQNGRFLVTRVNCDASDTYTTLWRKALKDVSINISKPSIGFNAEETNTPTSVINTLPEIITPDDIRRLLAGPIFTGLVLVLIFDEFDRLTDPKLTKLMADTIKALSDYSVPATILLIGVADSVNQLIHEHQSIERALVQVPMPRMSNDEIVQIIQNGLARLSMTIDDDALDEIATLSQGIPYITHLLGLHSSKAALADEQKNVTLNHLTKAISVSLDQWQQSIKTSYYDAVSSNQPDTLYKDVLLACALAQTDEMGFFSAANVREPLSIIAKKKYDIPGFARHLKEFSDAARGNILNRYGDGGRRYRFSSPLMRPYIIMRGFADGMLDKDQMDTIMRSSKLGNGSSDVNQA